VPAGVVVDRVEPSSASTRTAAKRFHLWGRQPQRLDVLPRLQVFDRHLPGLALTVNERELTGKLRRVAADRCVDPDDARFRGSGLAERRDREARRTDR
jgi:hypothetical protein